MLQSLMTVSGQVLVLFSMVAVGFLCGRTRLVGEEALTGIANLTLYAAIPCMLIQSFQVEPTADTLRSFLLALLVALGCHVLNFAVSLLFIREKNPDRKHIMVLTTTFTNCGYMGFPLEAAVMGTMGVFYGSAYNAVFSIFFWTAGVSYLQRGTNLQLRRILLNPGILGIAAGLILFFTQFQLPAHVNAVVNYLAGLCVPLPMIIIGCQLARSNLRQALRSGMNWLLAALRLLLLPLAELALLYLCGIRGDVLIATTIAAAAPPASLVSMMAQRCNQEPKLAAEIVSLQTLLSVATLPVIVALSQLLSGC